MLFKLQTLQSSKKKQHNKGKMKTMKLVTAFTLCLMLISSQVSEGNRLLLGENSGCKSNPGNGKALGLGKNSDCTDVDIGAEVEVSTSPTLSSPSPSPSFSPSPSPSPSQGGLQVGYYDGKCPDESLDVEEIIAIKVKEGFKSDPTLLPALLRLQFHDCFVHGCDASILVDGPSTEKTSDSNLSVRGYEFIESLKTTLEAECPGIVSCADIIAIATKVVLQLGGGPDYVVETGRKDGLVSNAADVDLPNPFMTVVEAAAAFAAKGFTAEEMVVLLGAHSVGITHCSFFQVRLYNDNSQFDPQIDPSLRRQLTATCPQGTATNNTAFLNQAPKHNNTVDSSFYNQLQKNRGVLQLDQALARDPTTSGIVLELAQNVTLFYSKLASAMVKLQAVDVLIENEGEVRQVCSKIN